MSVLIKSLVFEWDDGNLEKNWQKHEVKHQEAEEVFTSQPAIILNDAKHSTVVEERFMIWGKSRHNRYLTIIFTIRNSKIRVISARDMNKKERTAYETKI